MRIISSDGTVSMQFEKCNLEMIKTYLDNTWAIRERNNYVILAEYETEERCEEVFAELHDKYADLKRNELVLKSEADLMIKNCSEETLERYLDLTKKAYIYQFPAF